MKKEEEIENGTQLLHKVCKFLAEDKKDWSVEENREVSMLSLHKAFDLMNSKFAAIGSCGNKG